ncbi:MAG: hypothetical protein MI799_11125 [Desulfobacterales bacterium]|nr:hypothetical protein [Desulfobacterales bacterium]
MLGPGPLIAIGVICLYTILGPLVLFAIYVLLDSLSTPDRPVDKSQDSTIWNKDPALWNNDEIDIYMDQS